MTSVLTHMMRRRAIGLLWWAIGLAALAALLSLAYPTVRGNAELDKTFADLPPSVAALLGLTDGNLLTSPVGYLDSQLFANILPMILLIFAIGTAAWSIAGDEASGALELLLANPISRGRIALARYAALLILLSALAAVCAATLVALAKPSGLSPGVTITRLLVATTASALLALVFATLAFAIGAATGSRSSAIGVSAAFAVAGYVAEGLSHQVHALSTIRHANPWHWILADDPLRNGLTWRTWVLPLAVSALLVTGSLPILRRRDLR